MTDHHFADAGGLRLHFAEVPAPGPPLVLLHGIGMDGRVWQAVSRRLKPFFHLYMLDLRGHGQSQKPAHGYTLAHYAMDVEDFLDRMRLDPVILVGSSLGGMVAVSVEAPADVVSHRILVDPPMTGGPIRDEEMFREILQLKHDSVRALEIYLARFNPGAGRFYLRTMSEMWHQAADGVIEDMLARPHDYYAVDAALALDESPTLLMQAATSRGGVLSEEQAARALALLPRGSLMRFPGAGHAIHAYQPIEFVEAVRRFVGV
jgi:pimeloyl-ACP methyl ester carboxylesterase